MEKVYLETSVVSYLVARRSRDLIVAGRQQLTIDWWDQERAKFELYVSEAVLQEAQAGDPGEIAKRSSIVSGLPILTSTLEAERLTKLLMTTGRLPIKAAFDALHIALATVHQMDYLLTWKFTHIANAQVRKLVGRIFEAEGYASPEICTPRELGTRMSDDPIIEDLHRIREEMAAKFNYDVHAMFADIQAQQAKEDRPVVSFAKERKEELAEELEVQNLAA